MYVSCSSIHMKKSFYGNARKNAISTEIDYIYVYGETVLDFCVLGFVASALFVRSGVLLGLVLGLLTSDSFDHLARDFLV